MIDALMTEHTTDTWIARLEAVGVPCSAVNDLAQMIAHPQTQALGLVQDVPGTAMRFIGLPLSFDGQRPQPVCAPPKLGEHDALIIHRKHS